MTLYAILVTIATLVTPEDVRAIWPAGVVSREQREEMGVEGCSVVPATLTLSFWGCCSKWERELFGRLAHWLLLLLSFGGCCLKWERGLFGRPESFSARELGQALRVHMSCVKTVLGWSQKALSAHVLCKMCVHWDAHLRKLWEHTPSPCVKSVLGCSHMTCVKCMYTLRKLCAHVLCKNCVHWDAHLRKEANMWEFFPNRLLQSK